MTGRSGLGCALRSLDPVFDLGAQPLANAFLRPEDAARPESRVPLAVPDVLVPGLPSRLVGAGARR